VERVARVGHELEQVLPLPLQHAADEVGVAGARKGPLVEVDLERGFDGVAVEPVGHLTLERPGGVKNGKFVTLTPFQKNRPKSIKTPHINAKKVYF